MIIQPFKGKSKELPSINYLHKSHEDIQSPAGGMCCNLPSTKESTACLLSAHGLLRILILTDASLECTNPSNLISYSFNCAKRSLGSLDMPGFADLTLLMLSHTVNHLKKSILVLRISLGISKCILNVWHGEYLKAFYLIFPLLQNHFQT